MSQAIKKKRVLVRMRKDTMTYLLILPALIFTIVFAYWPMQGILIAFKDYNVWKGIWGSPWAGLKYIRRIFEMAQFTTAIRNTLEISVLSLLTGFPAPIVLALLINEIRQNLFKRVVQTVSYLPHFLSWISVVGLVQVIFGAQGIVNDVRVNVFGAQTRELFLSKQALFVPFVLALNVWKGVGWGTVVHLACLTSINPDLYEAAQIDGATRLQQTRFITLPHMVPTIMILLIFQMGHLFDSNFDLIYSMQNPYIDYEVISTIVYYSGIQQGNYSVATAVGFMQGVVAFLLTFGANWLSQKVSDVAIW